MQDAGEEDQLSKRFEVWDLRSERRHRSCERLWVRFDIILLRGLSRGRSSDVVLVSDAPLAGYTSNLENAV